MLNHYGLKIREARDIKTGLAISLDINVFDELN